LVKVHEINSILEDMEGFCYFSENIGLLFEAIILEEDGNIYVADGLGSASSDGAGEIG